MILIPLDPVIMNVLHGSQPELAWVDPGLPTQLHRCMCLRLTWTSMKALVERVAKVSDVGVEHASDAKVVKYSETLIEF